MTHTEISIDGMPVEEIHGGVFCHHCHNMMDLVVLQKSRPEWVKRAPRIVFEKDRKDRFEIEHCLWCGERDYYFDSEVKPIESWKEAIGRLEGRMDAVEATFKDKHFLSDLATEVVKLIDEQIALRQPKTTDKNPIAG